MSAAEFWKGEGGNAYVDRNQSEALLASYTAMWAKILQRTRDVRTVLEVGANIGMNLEAIRRLMPEVHREAIEPNESAAEALSKRGVTVHRKLAQEPWEVDASFDLVFTRGVLIHIPQQHLDAVYSNLYMHSHRYVMVAEYFSKARTMISYRGHNSLLWKADFASEMLDIYRDLSVVDYGFIWSRDPVAPQDDVTWTLMEKQG